MKLVALVMTLAVFSCRGADKGIGDISKIDKNMALESTVSDGIRWFDPSQAPFRLSGLPWFEANGGKYRRLPIRDDLPEGPDSLADNTTGAMISFRTDSSRIHVDVSLLGPRAMWNMSPIGHSALDIYVGGPGNWDAVGVTQAKDGKVEIYKAIEPKTMREFVINLPLYNGVKSLKVGLDEDAKVEGPTPFASSKKLVIYGGSVVQGASASRPGRAFMNMIGRYYNLEIVNLGFSGSSRFEPIMAEMTAAVENPALVIVEGDRNAGYARVKTLEPAFIQTIRKKHPGVPIVIMQGNPWWGADSNRAKIVDEQLAFFNEMKKTDPDLYWWDCSKFMGETLAEVHDCQVDGKHPNDLGFQRMFQHMTELLTPLFKKYNVIE